VTFGNFTKFHTFSNLWYKATFTFYVWIWLGTTLGVGPSPNRSLPYSIIHFPFPSHGGPHFPNFGIIWRYFAWIRMGTVKLCLICDIYGECRNCHRKMDCEKFSDRSMSQMSRQMSQNVTLVTFSVRKMDLGCCIFLVITLPYPLHTIKFIPEIDMLFLS